MSVSECLICFESVKCIECILCKSPICKGCFEYYVVSCLDDGRLPQCVDNKCQYVFTISLIKKYCEDNTIDKFTDLMVKIGMEKNDKVLAYFQDKNYIDNIAKKMEERRKKRMEALPINILSTINLLGIKSSGKKKIKKIENKLKAHKEKEGESEFIECPKIDCCGFINTITHKCNKCNIMVCSTCREIMKDKDHVCDKNILESLKTMKDNSRQCPKCKIWIQRTQGCNTMFCINCKSWFDYATGKYTNERHNPETASRTVIKKHTKANTYDLEYMTEDGKVKNLNKDIVEYFPDKFIDLYYKIFDTIKKLKSSKVEELQKLIHEEKISESKFREEIPKAYEYDYISNTHKQTLTNFMMQLTIWLKDMDYDGNEIDWIEAYLKLANKFNSTYSLKYKLPTIISSKSVMKKKKIESSSESDYESSSESSSDSDLPKKKKK